MEDMANKIKIIFFALIGLLFSMPAILADIIAPPKLEDYITPSRGGIGLVLIIILLIVVVIISYFIIKWIKKKHLSKK